MAAKAEEHDDDDDDTIAVSEAEVKKLGGIRDRIGRARFNEQVREQLGAKLKTRAGKPKSGFKAAEVPVMVGKVTDTDIEEAANKVLAAEAAATPAEATPPEGEAAAEGDAEAQGPIRDWFAANPELVKKVVDYLLRLILGA